MKTYEIRWALDNTGVEWIKAADEDEAVEIFNDYSITDLLGHVGNIAKVMRIVEVQDEDKA